MELFKYPRFIIFTEHPDLKVKIYAQILHDTKNIYVYGLGYKSKTLYPIIDEMEFSQFMNIIIKTRILSYSMWYMRGSSVAASYFYVGSKFDYFDNIIECIRKDNA